MPAIVTSRRDPAVRTFRQDTPAATWTITHNLNARPVVAVHLDTDPTEVVHTTVSYPDEDTVVLEFPSAVTGGVTI